MSAAGTTFPDTFAVYFTDGIGAVYRLDDDMYGSQPIPMPKRDRVLARALLELALVNLDRRAKPEVWQA